MRKAISGATANYLVDTIVLIVRGNGKGDRVNRNDTANIRL